MIFELVEDYADALAAIPPNHPRHRILRLLEEAIRRDVHFIDRHPTTTFQCLWNTCWWYDCPDAEKHYEEPKDGLPSTQTLWDRAEPRLHEWFDDWLRCKTQHVGTFSWFRSLRPPGIRLGGTQKAVLSGHEQAVTAVAFSPRGDTVASAAQDDTIRIWDTASSRCQLKIQRETASDDNSPFGMGGLAYSPDGLLLAGCFGRSGICVWDTGTGRQCFHCPSANRDIYSLCFSPDSRLLAVGFMQEIRTWDVGSWKERDAFPNSGGYIAFSPDGSRLASCQGDDLQVVDLADRSTATSVTLPMLNPECNICWSPDGSSIAVGLVGPRVALWDLSSGELTTWGDSADTRWPRAISFIGDGRRVAVAVDKRIWIHEALTGKPLVGLLGHQHRVTMLAYCQRINRLASASEDHTLRLWDPDGSALMAQRWGPVYYAAISPDGRRVACTNEIRIVINETDSGRTLWRRTCWHERRRPDGKVSVHLDGGPYGPIQFSPNGTFVAVGEGHGNVLLIELSEYREQIMRSPEHEGFGGSIQIIFSPDGHHVAVSGRGRKSVAWNIDTGHPQQADWFAHVDPISSFLPNLGHTWRKSEDGSIEVFCERGTLGWCLLQNPCAHNPTRNLWAGAGLVLELMVLAKAALP